MLAVGYTTYKYMARPDPSAIHSRTISFSMHQSFSGIFTEKSFFEEALYLTRGYKPIIDKLVEPIKPLKIDTSDNFNVVTLLGAQVKSGQPTFIPS